MSSILRRLDSRWGKLAFLAIAACLVLATGAATVHQATQRRLTAYFTEAKGLYVGNSVNVLGVAVGEVTKIAPEPDRVRVVMTIDRDQNLPADVKALITAPSLVPVRTIELTPVYSEGPTLPDGEAIPISRTAVPVEWDEVKAQMTEFSQALGPSGANKNGALSRAVTTAARNLKGQGPDINQTIKAMSEAMATLAENRGHVFGTVRNLMVFVEALRRADAQVADFNKRLAVVSGILDDNSGELTAAINGMNHAFGKVQRFLKDNRGTLAATVNDLQPLARALAENRQSLADVLHIAPHLMSNLYAIYEPIDGSLTASQAVSNLQAPAVFICTALLELGGKPEDCIAALGPLANLIATQPPGIGISALERNGRSNQVVARPGPEPDPGTPEARPDLAQLMTRGAS